MKKGKFIVPLVFSLDDYDFAPNLYMRPFYNFIYYAHRNRMPIIIQESYIADPEKLKEDEATSWYFDEWSMEQFGYELITKEEVDKIDKYIISDETVGKIHDSCKSQNNTFVELLKKNNRILEKSLNQLIDEIENKYERKIDAFMVWVSNKTIEKVCSDRGIKLIQMEMGPIRRLDWAMTIAYCMDRDKYSNDFVEAEYEEFKREVPEREMLSKDELLALFLKDEDSRYLLEKCKIPTYKFGIALSFPGDYFFNVHSKFSNEEMYRKALDLVDNDKIIVRSHPGSKYDMKEETPNYDNSLCSKDFIVKSDTVISGVSNINFQAMLFGRKSITTSDKMPWSFLDEGNLEYIADNCVDAKFLNYLTFCYFSPLREMFDLGYLEFKFFEKHGVSDLYRKNRQILLKKRGLDDSIFKLNGKERFKKIISTCFSGEFYEQYINYNYEHKLKNENEMLKTRLEKIERSKGYRYLEKIWRLKGRLSK